MPYFEQDLLTGTDVPEPSFTSPLRVLKYYPQRVIVLVNAAISAGAYFLGAGPETIAVVNVLASGVLVFFYGEPNTTSKAYLAEQ